MSDETERPVPPTDGTISRRDALGRLAALPVLTALPAVAPLEPVADVLAGDVVADPGHQPKPAGDGTQPPRNAPPKFFTAAEYRTLTVLVDDIIPRDARSGSASDAGVPAYIDLTVREWAGHQVPMRGGLAWLDAECRRRFGAPYASLTAARRHAVLDDIAYPKRARPEMRAGVAFFNRVRDLAVSGFYSSKIGYADLNYQGAPQAEWAGVPKHVLDHLGVSYEEWERR